MKYENKKKSKETKTIWKLKQIKRNTICGAGEENFWADRWGKYFEMTAMIFNFSFYPCELFSTDKFPIKGWIRFRNARFFVVPSNVKQQYDAAGMVTSKLTTLLLQFKMLCIPPTWKVINEILEFGSWRVGEHGLHYTLGHTVKCESKLAEETDSFLKSRPIRQNRCKNLLNLTLMHMDIFWGHILVASPNWAFPLHCGEFCENFGNFWQLFMKIYRFPNWELLTAHSTNLNSGA